MRQSDWAQLACLRNHWAVHADSMVVAHHDALPQIDLSVLGDTLLSGTWQLELSVDGEPRPPAADWDCSCWFSDRDADFLELQLAFNDGLQIDRQILLSRTNQFRDSCGCRHRRCGF